MTSITIPIQACSAANELGPGTQNALKRVQDNPLQRVLEISAVEFIRRRKRTVSTMSFWRLYYHLTWSTKDRLPLITEEIEAQLFSYLVRKAAALGGYVYAINGCSDHVHLVVAIPPDLAVSEFVKKLKGASSHYLNQTIFKNREFAWQRGYGVLSIGERQRQTAIEYINNQKRHHKLHDLNTWLETTLEKNDGPNLKV